MKRAELVKTLELVSPALGTTTLVPAWGCFMFAANAIQATNDVISIIAESDGSKVPFATGGVQLIGLLKNSHAEEVDFQVTDENVVVKTGKSVFKLPYFKQNEYPFEHPKSKPINKLPINNKLLKGIEICLTTAATDQSKPAFLGITFNFTMPKVTLYSTDSDAITKYTTETKSGGNGVYTVPNAFCEALLKIEAEIGPVQGDLMFNDDWVKAVLTDGYTIYGRIILNKDPVDYQGVLDEKLSKKANFVDLPLGFDSALARARVLADPESAKTVMTVEDGKLKLVTETHMGTVRDELRLKGHANVEAMVHASLVTRSLAFCEQLAILDSVTAYKQGNTVLQIVANIGE